MNGAKEYPIEIDGEDIRITVDGKVGHLSPYSRLGGEKPLGRGLVDAWGPVYAIIDMDGSRSPYDAWTIDYEKKVATHGLEMEAMWPDPCFGCCSACICGPEAFETSETEMPPNCPMPEDIDAV